MRLISNFKEKLNLFFFQELICFKENNNYERLKFQHINYKNDINILNCNKEINIMMNGCNNVNNLKDMN